MAFEELIASRGKGPKATKWDEGIRPKKKQNKPEPPFEFHDETDEAGFGKRNK